MHFLSNIQSYYLKSNEIYFIIIYILYFLLILQKKKLISNILCFLFLFIFGLALNSFIL